MNPRPIERTRILSLDEVRLVIKEQHRKRRYKTNRRNLILFRLATCCGLRVSELTQLRLCDIQLGGLRPSLRLPASICKADSRGRRRGRTVPLWWDAGTLADLTVWKAARLADGAREDDLVIITRHGGRIDRNSAAASYRRVCRPLGRHVTIHDGRHTFISTMLYLGHKLPAVQQAAGHANVATTGVYTHLMDDEECELTEAW